ncbi:putative DUF593 domain containing family protein isoform X1 [Zea mays]|jgi:hypothetical protein|uniref:GTD-binding domain-containing protein n=1 Tax=Zea mays TaxID=4577 RepID=B6TLG8_MAIZE|nr:putative DUF593 domain containing family protein isoform 1 [Zea mays]XP_008661747.1 putative DUF593 domain containing family protein isoform X1 [Zea mays]ACG37951.1 hypothetical protein [Zea mays]ACR38250.1 unknown [Zea mays]|eukprot:NP_001144108.1 putative DUF593 domain containing family protein isoform 1 [Zea mays]
MAGVEEEGEVAALREALRQQVQAVEELRAELEEERQAAASGADEALAMILRLQAEKAAERMEAEQFHRVAKERIQYDEDTLAFLRAVVFHQEMEISSLNRRLLAVHATGDDPLSPAVDLPWLRKLAKSGVASRRNASLPAAHLEELCSELDVVVDTDADKKRVGDRRPARTVSDIGEVISREKEWATRPNQTAPTPRLYRSASHSHGLPRRATCCSAQCGVRSAGRASPEIIAEEDEKSCKSNAALEADIEQIKATVLSLHTDLTKLRESTLSMADAHSQILAEIHAKLDGVTPRRQTNFEPRSELLLKKATRGGSSNSSSSSKEQSYQYQWQADVLMNHFIEVRGLTFSATTVVRPLMKAAASMSLFRCLLILGLAVAIRKVLINS